MTNEKALEIIEANIQINICSKCCYFAKNCHYSKMCEKCVMYQAIQTIKKVRNNNG